MWCQMKFTETEQATSDLESDEEEDLDNELIPTFTPSPLSLH